MLLTLKPPLHSEYPRPTTHAYSPPRSDPVKLLSPPEPKGSALPPFSDTHPQRMGTPHRLPPPLGMTLPNPAQDRGPPPPAPPSLSQTQPMGQLPPPPTSQWQGTEEAMRSWLVAKAEEDRRKQEEEKTRQESLRLEQRKIEQSILRESLSGGVPPHMVPMVFAGMGGSTLASTSVEWAQHWMAQMNLQGQQPPPSQYQQQVQALPPAQSSPDIRRERANPGPQSNPYAQLQPPPQNPAPSAAYPFDRLRSTSQAMQVAPGPTSAPRPGGLARLNTGEMQIHQPPPGTSGSGLSLQHAGMQQQQTSQQEPAQSTPTSIYFHHWQPPNAGKEPGTPSGKTLRSLLVRVQTNILLLDYAHSPKKRKTNAGHGKTPETSPSFAQLSSAGRRNRAHSLQQSEVSYSSRRSIDSGIGNHTGSRPSSRHRRPSGLSEPNELRARRGSSQPDGTQSSQSRQASTGPERKKSHSGTPKREAEGPPS